jgi:hypothetical protein
MNHFNRMKRELEKLAGVKFTIKELRASSATMMTDWTRTSLIPHRATQAKTSLGRLTESLVMFCAIKLESSEVLTNYKTEITIYFNITT